MKTIRFIALVSVMMFLVSCSDSFLDKVPDERVELTNEDQVMQLLGTAYSTANYGWLCEASSDNIIDINSPYKATQSNGTQVDVRFNLTSYNRMDEELYCFQPVKSSTSSDSPSYVWERSYKAIAVANHAIEILDQIKARNNGEETKKMAAAYGEAYLTRAYHHFILLSIFSQAYKNDVDSRNDVGVPYITVPEDRVLVNYDRSNVTETYNRIEEDLLKGLELVNDVYYEKPKWHFNRNAAHAFAARFYLYKRQYDKVIEHANAVLGEGTANLSSMLMNLEGFDEATSATDRAEIWQGPSQPNNLLLVATYSVQWRRSVGYRFATAGDALRDIYGHLGPNWTYYWYPMASRADGYYWDGNSDHGYKSSRIAERFEYSDKVAGIGYAHIIRRELTCSELLLNRAEAKLLGNKDISGCVEDLIAYEESRQSYSEKTKASLATGLRALTKANIESWYANPEHSNAFANWDFTQQMSSDFIVPAEAVVYMNCINDMRRYETAWMGLRFFDLKRFGIEIVHTFGPDAIEYKLTWNDPRRAIELPQEVLLAGLDSSQPDMNGHEADGNGNNAVNPNHKDESKK